MNTIYHYYLTYEPAEEAQQAGLCGMVVIGPGEAEQARTWAEAKLRAKFPSQQLQCSDQGMSVGPLTADEFDRMEAELLNQSRPEDRQAYRVQRRLEPTLREGEVVIRQQLRVRGWEPLR